jgi:phospholipid/cholesterol/gamma-HCH transport system substrate-binding protein
MPRKLRTGLKESRMETKANYVVIGLFTLAVIVGVFGFVYWFQNIGGSGERAFYRVVFDGTVSGLRTGGSVLFNGIKVGEVTDLKLNPDKPQQVIATVTIDKSVPVRADTTVGLEFQGLTGIASVALTGGTATSQILVSDKTNPPVLTAPAGANHDFTQAARDTLRRLDDVLAENQKAFHSAIENIEKFSGALARNSDRLDKISEGLQNLTGGVDGKGGQLNEAAVSVRKLSDVTTEKIDALTTDARRTLGAIDSAANSFGRAARNFDANPGRIIWGGAPSETAPAPRPKRQPR